MPFEISSILSIFVIACKAIIGLSKKEKSNKQALMSMLLSELSGSTLLSGAETSRPDPPSPAMYSSCCYSEAKGGGWVSASNTFEISAM